MITLTDMVANMQIDLGDEGAAVFTLPALTRFLTRAVVPVSADVNCQIGFDLFIPPNLTITTFNNAPVADGLYDLIAEALTLKATINACEQRRAYSAARARSEGIDTIKIERGDQAASWQKLEQDCQIRYNHIIDQINPSEDDSFVRVPDVTPMSYAVGGRSQRGDGCGDWH